MSLAGAVGASACVEGGGEAQEIRDVNMEILSCSGRWRRRRLRDEKMASSTNSTSLVSPCVKEFGEESY